MEPKNQNYPWGLIMRWPYFETSKSIGYTVWVMLISGPNSEVVSMLKLSKYMEYCFFKLWTYPSVYMHFWICPLSRDSGSWWRENGSSSVTSSQIVAARGAALTTRTSGPRSFYSGWTVYISLPCSSPVHFNLTRPSW